MLDPEYCRRRQGRLLGVIERRKLDAVVCGLPHHVQYLTGYRPSPAQQAAVVLFADGRSALVCGGVGARTAADEVIPFEGNFLGTNRQEQAALAGGRVLEQLAGRGSRQVGLDASATGSQVVMALGSGTVAVDDAMWELRRRKDPDELELIKIAIRCTEAMYARARQIIAPGVEELTVFTELHTAAVRAAGEPLIGHLGNDFACGVGGGAARRNRTARAGEIYILDLGPCYRGYFADNCRCFAVDGRPTDGQLKAWGDAADCLTIVERMARPGVRCRDIVEAVDQRLRQGGGAGLPHHLGHGIGLEAHEYPHLNPKWDDVLMEGEVFTAEPGVYGPHLAAGIRLENDYLVTADGVVNLVETALGLV